LTTPASELTFREGRSSDLAATYALAERALGHAAREQGVLGADAGDPDPRGTEGRWRADRPLIEFIAAQEGCHWICEEGRELVGFARTARFGAMDELTELMVEPSHLDRGIERALLERCWPGPPTKTLGRVVVASGAPDHLGLYADFGMLPVTGHWHLSHTTETYLLRRSLETADVGEPSIHQIESSRAVREWQRLEPLAVGHDRPRLHEFFGRTRTCLARFDVDSGDVIALCWVSPNGGVGPAVGASPEDLVPVVLAALDRVARTQEPEWLGVYCATDSWWLLRHLRRLGFRVYWPSWIMSSVPLPGLDRYLPSRPPHVL
jgi:hypothetical protein